MTISHALKEKNRLVHEISTLSQRLQMYNSYNSKNQPAYNTIDVYNDLEGRIAQLSRMKTAIAAASAPVRKKIFLLSEYKSLAQKLKSMHIEEGETSQYGRTTVVDMTATIGTKLRDDYVKRLEEIIEGIQDELDVFNAITKLDDDWDK